MVNPRDLLDDVAASMQRAACTWVPGRAGRALIAMVDNAILHSVDGRDVQLRAERARWMVTLSVGLRIGLFPRGSADGDLDGVLPRGRWQR